MPARLLLDHVILAVGHLPNAIRQFAQMGFIATPGGVHAGGFTQNALVSFADGSYLELLAAARRPRRTWLMWLRRFGLLRIATSRDGPLAGRLKAALALGHSIADFCLRSPDLAAAVPTLQSRGIRLEGPLLGGRKRPDGEEIAWRTAIPQSFALPFLIEDVTPRSMRVPPAPELGHPNRVTGIAGLSIAVKDLAGSVALYRSLLEIEPGSVLSFPLTGVQGAEFALDGVRIDLVTPEKGNLLMRKALGRRAVGPLVVWLSTPAAEPSGLLSLSNPTAHQLNLSRGNPFG